MPGRRIVATAIVLAAMPVLPASADICYRFSGPRTEKPNTLVVATVVIAGYPKNPQILRRANAMSETVHFTSSNAMKATTPDMYSPVNNITIEGDRGTQTFNTFDISVSEIASRLTELSVSGWNSPPIGRSRMSITVKRDRYQDSQPPQLFRNGLTDMFPPYSAWGPSVAGTMLYFESWASVSAIESCTK